MAGAAIHLVFLAVNMAAVRLLRIGGARSASAGGEAAAAAVGVRRAVILVASQKTLPVGSLLHLRPLEHGTSDELSWKGGLWLLLQPCCTASMWSFTVHLQFAAPLLWECMQYAACKASQAHAAGDGDSGRPGGGSGRRAAHSRAGDGAAGHRAPAADELLSLSSLVTPYLQVAVTVLGQLAAAGVAPGAAGLASVPAVIAHLVQIILDSVLASRWRSHAAAAQKAAWS